MNSPASPFRSRQKGFALIVTLLILTLLTVTIVSFFSQATGDLRMADTYSRSQDTKQLADSTVNLVIAQIRDATVGFERAADGSLDTDSRLAWASQPGMLRTWDDTGNDYRHYKLYSDDQMIISSDHTTELTTDITEAFDWTPRDRDNDGNAETVYDALWVDLNAPAVRADNSLAYPIVIPPDNLDSVNGLAVDDPTTPNQEGVQGFSIDNPTAFDSNKGVSPVNNPAAMPAKWLYVLADGTIVTPTPSGSSPELADLGPTATQANPPVGRIAFWTDDESCKVNINTASEGVFWDVPMGWSLVEYGNSGSTPPFGFSNAVPGDKEFQRTPGHPATTSLSAVFGGADLGNMPVQRPVDSNNAYLLEEYYDLIPQIAFGGTQGGTAPSSGANTITLDQERLYASIDELYYRPERQAYQEDADKTGLDAEAVSKARFFATTTSRAPDVTVWNTPRIALWPQMADSTNARNAKDRLLAFCSTLNDYPYYFSRATVFNPNDKNTDNLDAADFGSSQSQTEDFPGAPQTATGFDPDDDTTLPQRNRQLYHYLQELTDANIPGFGGSLANKYPEDRDQILTQIFDYIRSGIYTFNLTGLLPAYHPKPYEWNDSSERTAGRSELNASGSSVPIRIPSSETPSGFTQGTGRFITIGQVAFGFAMTDFKDTTTLAQNRGGQDHDPVTWWQPTTGGDGVPDDELSGLFTPTEIGMVESELNQLRNEIWDPTNSKFSDSDYDEIRDALPSPFLPDPEPTSNFMNTLMFRVFDGIGDPSTTEIRSYVLVNPINLMPGQPYITPYARVEIEGLENLEVLQQGGAQQNLGFPSRANANRIMGAKREGWGNYGSSTPTYFIHSLAASINSSVSPGPNDGILTNHNAEDFDANPNLTAYPWVSQPILIQPIAQKWGSVGDNPINWGIPNKTWEQIDEDEYTDEEVLQTKVFEMDMRRAHPKLTLIGGNITIRIYSPLDPVNSAEPIQTIEIEVPNMDMPTPTMPIAWVQPRSWWESNDNAVHRDKDIFEDDGHAAWNPDATHFYHRYIEWTKGEGGNPDTYDEAQPWDFEGRFTPYGGSKSWLKQLITKGDSIRSIAPNAASSAKGDLRLLALRPEVPINLPGDSEPAYAPYGPFNDVAVRQIFANRIEGGNEKDYLAYDYPPGDNPMIYAKRGSIDGAATKTDKGTNDRNNASNDHVYTGTPLKGRKSHIVNSVFYAGEIDGFEMANGEPGDFSAHFGNFAIGPWIMKGDEGFQGNTGGYVSPYYTGSTNFNTEFTQFSFSPNRQVPSPVMFGTLPTGVYSEQPWQTLLFCPNPAAGTDHPGFGQGQVGPDGFPRAPYSLPPDHLFLDLFHMPVVEPYAISEPFSTAGKVNLNQAIMPFGHIQRDTGLRAVLKSTKLMAVHNDSIGFDQAGNKGAYSMSYPTGFNVFSKISHYGRSGQDFRYAINLEETLQGWARRFTDFNDLYRSASEVCSLLLVPEKVDGYDYGPASSISEPTFDQTSDWWDDFLLTADNYRESPYNQIYPRVTTKSNIYRVHFTVQTLKKMGGGGANFSEWDEDRDQVLSEYRGSSVVERFIDPNDPDLPDFATLPLNDSDAVLDKYYRFRVLETKRFVP